MRTVGLKIAKPEHKPKEKPENKVEAKDKPVKEKE